MTEPGPATRLSVPIALIGAPGSGKSTVGKLLAARLGLELRDVDQLIEQAQGRSVSDIFADDGEPVFRDLEREHTVAALEGPGVVSLGGGAVMTAPIRDALRGAVVVWLRVSGAQAVQRAGLSSARPLLLGNVRGTLLKLLAERNPVYEACADLVVDTDDTTPEQIVEQVQSWLEHEGRAQAGLPPEAAGDPEGAGGTASAGSSAGAGEVPAAVGVEVAAERPYQVWVGHGVLDRLPSLVQGAQRVAILHAPTVASVAQRAASLVAATGASVTPLVLPDAEAAKDVTTLTACWTALADAGFTRSDLVVGVGGGATTDVAGFVAATWLRGVGLVTVPTTVLGMVDAALGGKTGINVPAGKNLVGAFYEPRGVLADLETLTTLPTDDIRAGLAEVIKTGLIADPEILAIVERDPQACLDPASAELAELIVRSVQVKARVVSADLRESTSTEDRVGRELLNYGHTLGHAVERREQFRWRHGEAVSVGLVFVAELARRAGLLDEATARRHERLLALVGLPTRYDPNALDELVAAMGLDKKTRGSTLRFVVLTGVGTARMLVGPPPELIAAAYAASVGA